MSNTGAIHFVVKMNVAEENIKTFMQLASELVEKSRAEMGNISYCLSVNKKDPCQLTFLECWKNREAIQFHGETEHFTRILPQLLELCTEKPVKETFIEL